ncbi:nitronate monooxygenase, partial [Mesorhizobium sp. M8A.F.Ca.ET.173.01.1.1]
FPHAGTFTKMIGIKYPIVQAVMGGFGVPAMASAVCEGGGLGGVGLSWADEQQARDSVRQVRAATKNPFAIGYALWFPPQTLTAVLEEGAPIIQFSWGTPTKEVQSLVKSFGAKLGMQVSNLDGTRQALDAGSEYIILQGQEAGGHVQAMSNWRDYLPKVLELAGTTPVLVAGGLGDGHALREVLNAGASGGAFGTRFVATKENRWSPSYKERIVQSKASDTILTVCFDGGWPNALHRVLKNKTTNMWEAAGSGQVGFRPGEGDVVASFGDMEFLRYGVWPPAEGMAPESSDHMALYCGTSVDAIRDIPSAKDLVKRLWDECLSSGK